MQNKIILASISLFFLGFVSTAQTPTPPPPVPSGPPPPVGFPIDSSIFILIVAALVYGIYKTYKLSNKTT